MQLDEQSFTVLETRGYVNALVAATYRYTQNPIQLNVTETRWDEHQKVFVDHETVRAFDPVPPMNQPRAMMILNALCEEILSQCTLYRTPFDPLSIITQALMDKAVPDEMDYNIAEEFICNEIVDSAFMEFRRQVTALIGTQGWRQWEVVGTNTIMGLIGGKDFRVAEWERYHGDDYRVDNEILRVNLTPTMNCIRYQLEKQLGPMANQIPIHPVLIHALGQHNSHHKFDNPPPLPLMELGNLGFKTYDEFYHRFISDPVDSFTLLFMQNRLDRNLNYKLELRPDYILVVTQKDATPGEEQRYYLDLRTSVDSGDWIPEREMKWMYEYERTHRC